MGVFLLNIKGHVGKNTVIPWFDYRKEKGNSLGVRRIQERTMLAVPFTMLDGIGTESFTPLNSNKD